jgi:hypothetical protein
VQPIFSPISFQARTANMGSDESVEIPILQ